MCEKISILGDSISTLYGHSPRDGVYYHPDFSASTGIAKAEDTWWGRVIAGLGGQLLVNHSYAGSGVCRAGYQAACAPWRIAKLGTKEAAPDRVLILTGLNDLASHFSTEDFGADYQGMLQELARTFPAAQICCATLPTAYQEDPQYPPFLNFAACTPLRDYNEEIRSAATAAGARLCDLAALDKPYCTLDGVHPNGRGMEQLAGLFLHCLNENEA